MSWQVGEDFSNVSLEEDKIILSEYKSAIEKLNGAVLQFKENKNIENMQEIRYGLSDIEDIPKKYERGWIHSLVDFDPDQFEILLETRITEENFYERDFKNSKCLNPGQTAGMTSQVDLEESQLEYSLKFVSYFLHFEFFYSNLVNIQHILYKLIHNKRKLE